MRFLSRFRTTKRLPWKVKACFSSGIDCVFVDDQAGDRRRLVVRQRPVERAVEVADRHRAVDDDRAVGFLLDAFDLDIVLVGNLADDLLDDVLQRHQAFDLAIFVDHDGEMRLAAQEGVELVLQRGGVRHEPGL